MCKQSHLFSQAISYKSNAGETQNQFQRNGLKDGYQLFGREHHSQPIGRSLKFHLTVLSCLVDETRYCSIAQTSLTLTM